MAPLHSSGASLLCSTHALAAVLDTTGPAALLLSRSFRIGSTQLPWHTAVLQYQGSAVQHYSTQQQQPRARRHKHQQQLDEHLLHSYTDAYDSQDGRSHSRPLHRQQQLRSTSHQKGFKQRHNMDSAATKWWPVSSRNSHQQQPQHLQTLPKSLGSHSSSNAAVAAMPSATAISEGALMSLIHRVGTLGDMEKILILYHASFRANHVSAAVATLPHLQPDTPYNKHARRRRLTATLAGAVLSTAHQMDVHQILGCIRAFTRPVCASPLQTAALDRLLAVLLTEDGRKLWKLQSDDLADLADAAAAMQLAVQQQRRRQQQQEGGDSQYADQDSSSSSSSKQLLLGLPDAAAGALQVSDQLVSSSSSSGNALALQSPLQRLWPLLLQVAKPQLDNFSAGSLALLLHSTAAAGQATDELLLLTTSAALAKSHKFDDPVTLTRMIQAVALCSSSSSRQINSQPVQQLLRALCSILAQNKAKFSTLQIVTCITALADLDHYSEAVCLAACKLACRNLKSWEPDQIAGLVRGLVRFRYLDDLLLKAVMKYFNDPDRVGQWSAAAVDVLEGLVQLGYRGADVEALAASVLGGLPAAPPHELTPSAAVKLLWAAAVLQDSSSNSRPLQHMLIRRLTDYANAQQQQQQQQQQLCDADLRLLYQAHRLLTDEWLQDKQQQQQLHSGSSDWSDTEQDGDQLQVEYDQPPLTYVVIGDDDAHDNGSSSRGFGGGVSHNSGPDISQPAAAAAVGGQAGQRCTMPDLGSSSATGLVWPPTLLAAAHRAAAAHARQSAKRSRRMQQHVQDLFDQIGLEPPVQGFRVDRGALQPDLAFVAQGRGLGLQIALMCDHDVRYTCNVPFELLGCETVDGWLLEKAGWKVVRLPPHEWELILQDERVHEGSALAYLYNTLAAQGIPL